ncbi:MAG: hypothetical protein LBQ86_00770, partial [Holophagales bacterium]|nr:hypothetical protein [Holophagales bacterium]
HPNKNAAEQHSGKQQKPRNQIVKNACKRFIYSIYVGGVRCVCKLPLGLSYHCQLVCHLKPNGKFLNQAA